MCYNRQNITRYITKKQQSTSLSRRAKTAYNYNQKVDVWHFDTKQLQTFAKVLLPPAPILSITHLLLALLCPPLWSTCPPFCCAAFLFLNTTPHGHCPRAKPWAIFCCCVIFTFVPPPASLPPPASYEQLRPSACVSKLAQSSLLQACWLALAGFFPFQPQSRVCVQTATAAKTERAATPPACALRCPRWHKQRQQGLR
jgi:hypothetical protein